MVISYELHVVQRYEANPTVKVHVKPDGPESRRGNLLLGTGTPVKES